jgi:hypothetical protein
MKLKIKNEAVFFNRHDLFIMLLIIVAVILIIAIWMWYGHKNAQLEQEIYRLK